MIFQINFPSFRIGYTSHLSDQYCPKEKTYLLEILLLASDASAEVVRRPK